MAITIAINGFGRIGRLVYRIAAERDEAVTQRAVADGIAEYLVDLFEMAVPDPERAEAMRAHSLR